MKTIVFACVHNAGRSQMAAGFFNALADASQAQALSAGTKPAAAIQPPVLAAMREVGIDLSSAKPVLLTREQIAKAERVVTMGCGEDCPYVPGARFEDWPLDDPKGQSIEDVRRIRDEIRARVEALLVVEGWRGARSPR